MQEMVVEDDSLRHKSHERVYKELGGKADRNLGRFLKQTSPMLGEYYCTIKSLPSAPGSAPDDCKVYVFSDSVLIALVQKNLKRSREPRNGIIDFAGQQSIIKFSSARDSWLRRFPGKYRMIHWLDLRQCKFKFDKPSSINVRYILRTRETALNPDDHARVVTRIASYELDFSHLDFGSVVRDRLHDDLVGSQASLGIAGSRKSTHRSSVRVSRHRWSTQSTDSSLQRRRSAIALQRSSIGHSRASVERKSERPLSTSSTSSASSRISGRASIAALRRSADIQSRYLS